MKFKADHLLLIGVTLVAVAGVVGFLNAWESRSEWKERAERFEAERDSSAKVTSFWRDTAQTLKKRVAEADSATQRVRIALENTRETADSALRVLRQEEEDAGIARDSLESALINAIEADVSADSQKFVANQLFSAQRRQVSALQGQVSEHEGVIERQSDLIDAQERQIVRRDSVIIAQDSIISSQMRDIEIRDRQIAELEDELKPGFFDLSTADFFRDLGLLGIGYALGQVTS